MATASKNAEMRRKTLVGADLGPVCKAANRSLTPRKPLRGAAFQIETLVQRIDHHLACRNGALEGLLLAEFFDRETLGGFAAIRQLDLRLPCFASLMRMIA